MLEIWLVIYPDNLLCEGNVIRSALIKILLRYILDILLSVANYRMGWRAQFLQMDFSKYAV